MHSTTLSIINILADGNYHTGSDIGKTLNLTRGAVWKSIQGLSSFGIPIESDQTQGYKIPDGLELLDADNIMQYISPSNQPYLNTLEILLTVNSTNDYLLKKSQTNTAQPGHIVLTEHQSAGKGRQGRPWHSPFGTNIYLSALWHFNQHPAELSTLSLAVAVAIINALKKENLAKNIQVKWPNDLVFKPHKKSAFQKLGGILINTIAEHHDLSRVVVGIGLNLRPSPMSKEQIDQPFTDLQTINQKTPPRNTLTSHLINELLTLFRTYTETSSTSYLKTWQTYDCTLNQPVTLHTPHKKINGIAQGVNERGELKILDENNKLKTFLSGEVSLRINQPTQ